MYVFVSAERNKRYTTKTSKKVDLRGVDVEIAIDIR